MHALRLVSVVSFLAIFYAAIDSAWSAESGKYIALVIGNSKYDVGFLAGPENDAIDIAKALKKIGFDIANSGRTTNLNRSEMKAALASFVESVDKNSFVVVYYSGHGLEDNKENYLVPTDAKLDRKADLEDQLVSLEWILKRLDQREARTKIIILDACRNMPSSLKYKEFTQGGGLADLKRLGPGTRVIYAASPDEAAIAASAGERNSVFTGALLEAFNEKLGTFNEVLDKAAQITLSRTENRQAPWSAGVLGMSFRLAPQVSAVNIKGSDNEVSQKYVSPAEPDISNCNAISQVTIVNGVSTWTKKCI